MRFRTKILLSPVVAVAFMLLLGGVAAVSVRSIQGQVNDLANESMQHMVQASEIRDHLRQANSDAFRLFVWLASGNDEAKVKKQWAEIDVKIDNAQKAFNELTQSADSNEQALLQEIGLDLAKYRKSVDAAINMGLGDVTAGAGLVQGSNKIFDHMTERLDAYVAKQRQDGADTLAATRDAVHRTMVFSIALSIVAALLSLLLAWQVTKIATARLDELVTMFTRVETSLDFTGRLSASGNDEFAHTTGAFNRLLDRLQSSFREILADSNSLEKVARQLADVSKEISTSATSQSEAATTMAASMEEMTVSIHEVSERAKQASALSASSGEEAQAGEDVIAHTTDDIQSVAGTVRTASEVLDRLERQSEQISHVVAVIKEVADQTNLLALNAAIEAARAGEQGRGFAVVADEVRKLAERTAQSTREIASTIAEMQGGADEAARAIHLAVDQVTTGVSGAEQANRTMQAIGSSSRQAVSMVEDISCAILEQSTTSTDIARRVELIAQMAEQNSEAACRTSSTADEVARLAMKMQNVVNQYRV